MLIMVFLVVLPESTEAIHSVGFFAISGWKGLKNVHWTIDAAGDSVSAPCKFPLAEKYLQVGDVAGKSEWAYVVSASSGDIVRFSFQFDEEVYEASYTANIDPYMFKDFRDSWVSGVEVQSCRRDAFGFRAGATREVRVPELYIVVTRVLHMDAWGDYVSGNSSGHVGVFRKIRQIKESLGSLRDYSIKSIMHAQLRQALSNHQGRYINIFADGLPLCASELRLELIHDGTSHKKTRKPVTDVGGHGALFAGWYIPGAEGFQEIEFKFNGGEGNVRIDVKNNGVAVAEIARPGGGRPSRIILLTYDTPGQMDASWRQVHKYDRVPEGENEYWNEGWKLDKLKALWMATREYDGVGGPYFQAEVGGKSWKAVVAVSFCLVAGIAFYCCYRLANNDDDSTSEYLEESGASNYQCGKALRSSVARVRKHRFEKFVDDLVLELQGDDQLISNDYF